MSQINTLEILIAETEKELIRLRRLHAILVHGAEVVDSDKLEVLSLSIRTYNSLKRGGIAYVKQLIDIVKDNPENLNDFRGLGAQSRREIFRKLAKEGFITEEYCVKLLSQINSSGWVVARGIRA